MISMIGMLWFDVDPMRTLAQKINTAMDYHVGKYGKRVPLCLMSLKDAAGVDLTAIGKECNVTLRASRSVCPGHLWLGEEKEFTNND